ncbi:hypothetical protein THAOC_18638 [Thalassiosira oceanica]|uniref:Uncharacterized protein n=1 Tax=Thalassiosira oceanica TaxID=159749 RepID=K0SRI3_THAOC|nr:hypothetical protein THAOC_18638 [Thalassiosira oceanica]|eukprot:EJK60942.1 hypothetical protein THAOC_18638 [Thalassiosira oceanica]
MQSLDDHANCPAVCTIAAFLPLLHSRNNPTPTFASSLRREIYFWGRVRSGTPDIPATRKSSNQRQLAPPLSTGDSRAASLPSSVRGCSRQVDAAAGPARVTPLHTHPLFHATPTDFTRGEQEHEDLWCMREGPAEGVLQRQAMEAQEEPAKVQRIMPGPDSYDEDLPRIQKRVNTGDPVAINYLADCYLDGSYGLEKDMPKAIELLERAAELGFNRSHFKLGVVFDKNTDDRGIDKDMVRAVEHYEFAAMRGHASSRHILGCIELNMGNYGLALKHWMISAKLGMRLLWMESRTFKEMRSPKRDEAEAFQREIERMRKPVDRVGHGPRLAVLEPVGDPVPRQDQEDERPHDRHGPARAKKKGSGRERRGGGGGRQNDKTIKDDSNERSQDVPREGKNAPSQDGAFGQPPPSALAAGPGVHVRPHELLLHGETPPEPPPEPRRGASSSSVALRPQVEVLVAP